MASHGKKSRILDQQSVPVGAGTCNRVVPLRTHNTDTQICLHMHVNKNRRKHTQTHAHERTHSSKTRTQVTAMYVHARRTYVRRTLNQIGSEKVQGFLSTTQS